MNAGLIFIKPHAANTQTRSFVEKYIDEAGIIVEKNDFLSGEEIESRGIIDLHYFSISMTAMKTKPAELSVQKTAVETFNSTYGLSWREAISANLVMNSADFMKARGIKTGEELTKVWSAGQFMKLGPGLYVCRVHNGDEFLINGFYPGMREKFTRKDATVIWYAVHFDERNLHWEAFRKSVIGATDPSKADQGSIRNILFSDYRDYGLDYRPTMSDNGVHASAGPIEGMRERMVWANIKPEDSELGKQLLEKGLKQSELERLLENGQAEFAGSQGPVFDITEDTDASKIPGSLSI